MATLDEVAGLALELPEVAEGERHGGRTWGVRGKVFAWERPFSQADLKRFGAETPPAGPILGIRTEDLNEKEALLAAHPGCCFTIPHFDGYAAVLVRLDNAPPAELRELLWDGWQACAPPALAREHTRQTGS